MKKLIYLFLLIGALLAVTPAAAQGPQPPQPPRPPQVRSGGGLSFGGNVVIDQNTRADDSVVFGGNVLVRSGGTVQDVVMFGGNLTVEQGGKVLGDAVLLGGNVDMSGEMDKDVVLIGGNLTLRPTAVVNGDVQLVGGHVNRSEGAVIRGSVSEVTRFSPRIAVGPFMPSITDPFRNPMGWIRDFEQGMISNLFSALATAALGVLLLVFFPQPTRRVMDTVQTATVPSFGTGCLTAIVGAVLMLGLAITLIGIPISVLLGIVMAVGWFFGWIAIGYLAGEKIMAGLKVKEYAPVLAMAVGVIIIGIVGEVPCFGGIVSLLVGTLGLGAVALTRFGTRAYPYTAFASYAPMTQAPMPPVPVTRSEPPVVSSEPPTVPPASATETPPPTPRADATDGG